MPFITLPLKLLALVLGGLGLVGTVWPVLPGFFVLLVTVIFWATITGFRLISWSALLGLMLLAGLAQVGNFLLLRLNNPYTREARQEQVKALLGGSGSLLAAGLLLGPFPGLIAWETFIGRFLADPLREGFFWAMRLTLGKIIRFLAGLFIFSYLLAAVFTS